MATAIPAKWIEALRSPILRLGELGILIAQLWRFTLQGRIRWDETLRQTYEIGIKSAPIVVLISIIGGGVLGLQISKAFVDSGTDSYVGGVVALTMVREIAPIFTALALAARSGTAIASELSSWVIYNQVDALEMLHIHPVRYLVLPRLLASLLATPALTLMSAIAAIASSMLTASLVAGISYTLFLQSVWLLLPLKDVWLMLFKGGLFGALVILVATQLAFNAKGGARAIGQAAMKTAVWASIWMAVCNFVVDYWVQQFS